jgi:type II secretory pathway component PulK
MNEELIAKEIKSEILIKNLKRYFDTLDESSQEPFKNFSWRKAQLLYNSIDETNRDNLKEFIKMIMIETLTDLLAFVDGIATFKDQEYPFELMHNGTKVSGSLQEYLIMDIEDNGFE